MLTLNRATIMGTIDRDPERHEGGFVACTVVVPNSWGDGSSYFDVYTKFRKVADVLDDCRAGDAVVLSGSVGLRSYDGRDGKVFRLSINPDVASTANSSPSGSRNRDGGRDRDDDRSRRDSGRDRDRDQGDRNGGRSRSSRDDFDDDDRDRSRTSRDRDSTDDRGRSRDDEPRRSSRDAEPSRDRGRQDDDDPFASN